MSFGGAPKCPVCSERVYFAEEVKAIGNSYHKRCFCCQERGCGKSLDSVNVTEHEGKVFCKTCHSKNFGTGGYGYGIGAGVLQTDHGQSLAGVRAANAKATQNAMSSKFGGQVKCPRCSKAVYHAEKVTAVGKDWHRTCFKCFTCGKSLEVGQLSDRDDEIYCKGCYGRNFGPKGVGYGVGAGTLQT